MKRFQLFLNKRGMAAVEYAILVVMIAAAIVIFVSMFGESVNGIFEKVNHALKMAGKG